MHIDPCNVIFLLQAKPQDTLDLSQLLNNDIAETVKKYPKRFVGLGTLPMQAPELAVQELIRCKKELGQQIKNFNIIEKRLIYCIQNYFCPVFFFSLPFISSCSLKTLLHQHTILSNLKFTQHFVILLKNIKRNCPSLCCLFCLVGVYLHTQEFSLIWRCHHWTVLKGCRF